MKLETEKALESQVIREGKKNKEHCNYIQHLCGVN